MIERGERVPHVETLASLAQALQVRIGDLFAEPPGESPQDVVQPLLDFVSLRHLSARDVEKLLGVARALFDGAVAS